MHEVINPPPLLTGDSKTQIAQLRAYLFAVSESMNRNLDMIGGNDLTDRERAAVQGVIQQGGGLDDVASLRDMVVRLAEYVKKAVGQIEVNPLENEVTSGRFGRYVQQTLVVLPAEGGSEETKSILTALRGLKTDDITLLQCVIGGETTETDINSITDPGRYWIDISGTTNGPTGESSGTCMLDISTTTGIIRQRLEAAGAVYIRRKTESTWGSWYKYTGTAV